MSPAWQGAAFVVLLFAASVLVAPWIIRAVAWYWAWALPVGA